MYKDIQSYIQSCSVCQQCKYDTAASPGLLQPLPIPATIWSDNSMDFIDGLPLSLGKSVIFVVVDRLTKAAHFMALAHPYTAVSVAQLFLDNIFKLHGLPNSIVSDIDAVFLSEFWRELFTLQGVSLNYSSAYHPQSDGQTEVVNRCVETYLRCMCSDRPHLWSKWLPLA
uniref:Transposon Tf2-9 polyprotein n=1 Tax=Noccaea caerulescens TaxID=107243 RepID=A0A1J3DX06_NOCCA